MHESFEFDGIAAFIQTARLGSFAAAGRVLGRDASVITRRVGALEKSLGVRLLARNTRRMKLTEAGQRYLSQVQPALALLSSASEEASTHSSEVQGTLRISLPISFGRLHITPRLGQFIAAHPRLTVDARLSDQYVDLVEEGFDVAIRLGVLEDSTLIARQVADYRHRVYASPAYLRDAPPLLQPRDLAGHPCLGFAGFQYPERWVLRKGREEISVTVPLVFRTDDGEALVQAAESGCGPLMVADWMAASSVAAGRLVPVLPAWCNGAPRQIHVVTPNRTALPAKTKAFVRWATEQIRAALALPRGRGG